MKPSTAQSNTLPPGASAGIKAGEYPILAYADADANHVKVTFDPTRNPLRGWHPSGKNTWFLYNGHIEISGTEPGNHPKEKSFIPGGLGRIYIPGLGPRALADPIDGCKNFSWGAATHRGRRIPVNVGVAKNIIKVAASLEEARSRLGNEPIYINSWYRPPAINRQVGGATNSRHIQGDAVDFRHASMSPGAVYQELNAWWGNRGGLASSSVFTHIDCRGYRARWSYNF